MQFPITPRIQQLLDQVKNSGGKRVLTSEEINLRLHLFNLTNDWGVFGDVNDQQAVCVMYPSCSRLLGWSDAEYLKHLEETFGPLPEPEVSCNHASSP